MIFIDSDAFIALNHKLDAHHQKSLLIFKSIHESGEMLITSWEVIDEVATKLSLFLTKSISQSFIDNVFDSHI